MAILPHVGNGANIHLELATPVSPRRGETCGKSGDALSCVTPMGSHSNSIAIRVFRSELLKEQEDVDFYYLASSDVK